MYDVANLKTSILLNFRSTGSVGIIPRRCVKALSIDRSHSRFEFQVGFLNQKTKLENIPPIDLHMIFEKSKWKNKVDFLSISELNFAGYTLHR